MLVRETGKNWRREGMCYGRSVNAVIPGVNKFFFFQKCRIHLKILGARNGMNQVTH
jgi:hypothetical protein